jgi:hypothetical protein
MRTPRTLGTALLLAVASTTANAQDGVQVGITTSNSRTIWYTDPLWIWAGAGVVLLIIVLAVMASRKKSTKRTTTVVR